MNKLQMAHDYAIEMLKRGDPERSIAFDAWTLADAMQAEADKRKPIPKLPALQQTFIDGVEQPRYAPSCDEWQPDWSQAPNGADAWRMYGDGKCAWLIDIGGDLKWLQSSPSFDYSDVWQDSLRKRPQ